MLHIYPKYRIAEHARLRHLGPQYVRVLSTYTRVAVNGEAEAVPDKKLHASSAPSLADGLLMSQI